MKRALILLALAGCASRQTFPNAKPSDIIACRALANLEAPVFRNGEFNRCMEEAGYKAAP